MKKTFFSALAVIAVGAAAFGGYITCPETASTSNQLLAENIEALASNAESGGSCSASAICYWGDTKQTGSVSCTGTENCSSGYEWVECDGKTHSCK